jgi:hypothetical protein
MHLDHHGSGSKCYDHFDPGGVLMFAETDMSEEELPGSVIMLPASAILYLVAELERLKWQVESHDSRIADITARQDEDCDRLARDIAYDRQRLARLEAQPDPTPSQKDRGEILRALLAAHGGKMPVKEARQKMHLSKAQFSQLLASMDDGIEMKPYHLDRRQKILIMKG